jgi:hypothetical protein
MNKITPTNITKLKRNEIFVFGSNLLGNHAGGAALLAVQSFGALNGYPIGIQGQSYAIPTLTESMSKVMLPDLQIYIDSFLKYATETPKKKFLVTEIGCGIAGFTQTEIAPLFKSALDLSNVYLPQSFIDIIAAPIITHGFKGYDQNMKCRDHQYEVGQTYEMAGEAKACQRGFHFCEHPLDVFNYYPPATSRFTEVQGEGTPARHPGGDSKVAVSKIHIGAEINIASLTKAAVKFVFDRAKYSKEPTENATGYQGAASATGTRGAASATGYQGAASATGYQGAASATGDQGAASATGDQGAASATGTRGAASATGYQGAASATGTRGAASATGDQGAASATGYQGAASATGTRGAASATGYQGAASATGYQGAASATGDQGAASATGDQGAASATGYQGAAVSLGIAGKAKGAVGAWITIAEWKLEDFNWNRVDVQTVRVDGDKIKGDTYYQLVDGKFVEA